MKMESYTNILNTIGNTPLLELARLSDVPIHAACAVAPPALRNARRRNCGNDRCFWTERATASSRISRPAQCTALALCTPRPPCSLRRSTQRKPRTRTYICRIPRASRSRKRPRTSAPPRCAACLSREQLPAHGPCPSCKRHRSQREGQDRRLHSLRRTSLHSAPAPSGRLDTPVWRAGRTAPAPSTKGCPGKPTQPVACTDDAVRRPEAARPPRRARAARWVLARVSPSRATDASDTGGSSRQRIAGVAVRGALR